MDTKFNNILWRECRRHTFTNTLKAVQIQKLHNVRPLMSLRGVRKQIKWLSAIKQAFISPWGLFSFGQGLIIKGGIWDINQVANALTSLYAVVICFLKTDSCCCCHACANAASFCHGSRASCRFTRARGDSNRFHTLNWCKFCHPRFQKTLSQPSH